MKTLRKFIEDSSITRSYKMTRTVNRSRANCSLMYSKEISLMDSDFLFSLFFREKKPRKMCLALIDKLKIKITFEMGEIYISLKTSDKVEQAVRTIIEIISRQVKATSSSFEILRPFQYFQSCFVLVFVRNSSEIGSVETMLCFNFLIKRFESNLVL